MAWSNSRSCSSSRPGSSSSRPSSITRSSRDNFVAQLQYLPPENVDDKSNDVEEILKSEYGSENNDHPAETSTLNEVTYNNDCEVDYGEQNAHDDTETQIDPKIKKGLQKIKKLDKILAVKSAKEKEIKKERILLQKEFQAGVHSLIEEKGIGNICGSQQLLSLCSANKCFEHEDEDIVPIFTTQLNMDCYQDEGTNHTQPCGVNAGNDSEIMEENEVHEKTAASSKSEKDFIRRNIQLAAHANETIPLTAEERKRLDELLANDHDLLLVDNPFSAPSQLSGGYQFSIEDKKALEDIEAKLKELIPEEDFNAAILNESWSTISERTLTGGDRTNSVDQADNYHVIFEDLDVECGEKVLQEDHDIRTISVRLNDIETQLQQLQLSEADDSAHIDPDLLRRLLDVDSRLTSSSRSICSSVKSGNFLLNDVDVSSMNSLSVTALDTTRLLDDS